MEKYPILNMELKLGFCRNKRIKVPAFRFCPQNLFSQTKNRSRKKKGKKKKRAPVIFEKAIVIKIGVVFEVFELVLSLLVDPRFVLGKRIFIGSRRESWGLEGRWLGRKVPELSLKVVPLSRSSFYVLVHKMVPHFSLPHCVLSCATSFNSLSLSASLLILLVSFPTSIRSSSWLFLFQRTSICFFPFLSFFAKAQSDNPT